MGKLGHLGSWGQRVEPTCSDMSEMRDICVAKTLGREESCPSITQLFSSEQAPRLPAMSISGMIAEITTLCSCMLRYRLFQTKPIVEEVLAGVYFIALPPILLEEPGWSCHASQFWHTQTDGFPGTQLGDRGALKWHQQGQSLCYLPGPYLQTPLPMGQEAGGDDRLVTRRLEGPESKPMEQHQREALCGEIALFSDNDIVAGMA